MKDLAKAMIEEELYLKDKFNGKETSLQARLIQYGYTILKEYFDAKKEYLFNNWKPEVYFIPIEDFAEKVENAIQASEYGIYIPIANGIHAYHGTDEIDYLQCEQEGIQVIELNYNGGTIIGSEDDFSIEIVAPINIGLDFNCIINKFYEIISKYEDNVVIDGNDILINGNKVLGSMTRRINNTFVWAAQATFGDHIDAINKICKKKSAKAPGRIKSNYLTREKLQNEVISWLQKS